MKFPLSVKIEKAASRDESRPILTQLYLRIVERKVGRGRNRKVERAGFMEATNSYILARVPVQIDEDDTGGFIPVEAIQRARSRRVEQISASAGVRVGNVTFDRQSPGTWPDMDKCLTDASEIVFSVGLNAKFLSELAEALGSTERGVRLDFRGTAVRTRAGKLQGVLPQPLKPIRITPLGGEAPGAEGVLMPIRMAEYSFDKDLPPAPRVKPAKRKVRS